MLSTHYTSSVQKLPPLCPILVYNFNMQILKPQTGDFYIYSLGRVTSNQENFPNKSRRTLTEFWPVVLCARVFIQDPHELFTGNSFMFIQIRS